MKTIEEKIAKNKKKLAGIEDEIKDLSTAIAGDLSLLTIFNVDKAMLEKKIKRLERIRDLPPSDNNYSDPKDGLPI